MNLVLNLVVKSRLDEIPIIIVVDSTKTVPIITLSNNYNVDDSIGRVDNCTTRFL